ncbi:hypothetical protein [Corallococcus exiguus]|uniref:hypothetical protein n=1 Tax=Corallococcus exiguus TaxID=83462 RepID=UPI00147243B5|nr:hypothetical protein [Corallococcus exiguus]NNB85399.1 hypothetical protein [Corallococcus exiguus]
MTQTIKRLALLFDEIYITPPTLNTIKDSFIKNNTIQTPNGERVNASKFNYFRDTEESLSFPLSGFKDSEFRETVHALKEAGILKSTQQPRTPEDINNAKFAIISGDIKDKEFNKICRTKPADYDLLKLTGAITIRTQTEPPADIMLHTVADPPAVEVSKSITGTLIASDHFSSIPIFHSPDHRAALKYKYEQYKLGLDILNQYQPSALAEVELRTRIGEVAFSVSNEIFAKGALTLCAADEIIRYRSAMEEARHRYVSEDITGFASLLKDNPWSEQTRLEVTKYIHGKLNPSLAQYDRQLTATYQKLFGQLAAHATNIALGGGIATLTGNVIPNANPWHLLLVGSLVGAAKEGAQVVKTIVDLWAQKKNDAGSSIAFVANFERKTSVGRRKKLMGIDND